MGDAEIAMIKSYLQPSQAMLEWGAGGSTLCYPLFVRAYFSIEHDPQWFQLVANELQRRRLAQVKLFHGNLKVIHNSLVNNRQ
jgi:hypothetical protein